jgi:hypothetical protein
MLKNGKKTTAIIIILIIAAASFLWYKSYSAKNNLTNKTETKSADSSQQNAIQNDANSVSTDNSTADENAAMEELDFNAICENGEWVKIAEQTGSLSSFSGKLRKVYPDDEAAKEFAGYQYYLEGPEKIALAGANLEKMDYFEDREVEIQGVKSTEKKEVAVSQVKCGGAETDKNLINDRKKMMDYIAANINTIAPKKAKYKSWVVDEIDIVNENNVYVMYYDTVEDDENSNVEEDTGRRVLLEVSAKTDGTYGLKQIAYFEMGEDDYVVKQGEDKFADSETVDYSYDPDAKVWERY